MPCSRYKLIAVGYKNKIDLYTTQTLCKLFNREGTMLVFGNTLKFQRSSFQVIWSQENLIKYLFFLKQNTVFVFADNSVKFS